MGPRDSELRPERIRWGEEARYPGREKPPPLPNTAPSTEKKVSEELVPELIITSRPFFFQFSFLFKLFYYQVEVLNLNHPPAGGPTSTSTTSSTTSSSTSKNPKAFSLSPPTYPWPTIVYLTIVAPARVVVSCCCAASLPDPSPAPRPTQHRTRRTRTPPSAYGRQAKAHPTARHNGASSTICNISLYIFASAPYP